jgi:hypothetical protein
MTELYFPQAMTIALAPGKAAQFHVDDVVDIPEPLASQLTRRTNIIAAQGAHKELRRWSLESRMLPPEKTTRVAPQLSEESLLRDFSTRKRLAALRAEMASS